MTEDEQKLNEKLQPFRTQPLYIAPHVLTLWQQTAFRGLADAEQRKQIAPDEEFSELVQIINEDGALHLEFWGISAGGLQFAVLTATSDDFSAGNEGCPSFVQLPCARDKGLRWYFDTNLRQTTLAS